MKMITQCTLAPLRFHPLAALKKGHVMHVEYFGKTKDHSPSMMLSWLPKQNDLVPQKIAKNT